MIHKVIHISDIHIRTFKYHNEYKEVFENFYKDAKEAIKDYKYEEVRIAIVGDVVHQKITISNELMLFVAEFLNKCAEIAPVILVAGNHDLLETNKTRMDSLTPIINLINNPKINFLTESKCYVDDNVVWANYSIFEDNSRPNIEESRKENLDKTFIGLFHAPITSSKTDAGYEFKNAVNLTYFDGCDMTLLGDIHKRQSFEYNGQIIAYPSSLIQQNFGESISSHGFLLWDIETKKFEEYDVENGNLYYKFKIESVDCIKEGKEILMNA